MNQNDPSPRDPHAPEDQQPADAPPCRLDRRRLFGSMVGFVGALALGQAARAAPVEPMLGAAGGAGGASNAPCPVGYCDSKHVVQKDCLGTYLCRSNSCVQLGCSQFGCEANHCNPVTGCSDRYLCMEVSPQSSGGLGSPRDQGAARLRRLLEA